MDLNQRYPRNLIKDGQMGWLGYTLLATIIILSAGIAEKLADWVQPMSWLMSFLGRFT